MTTQTIGNVQIVVDDRERPSGVVAELEKTDGVVVKIEHLSLGDYCVDGAVLIERKAAADFARSLIDGRLFDQAGRLSSSQLRPAYIIEGTSAEWALLGVSRESLQGALITLMLIFDIPVLRSLDPAESARLILYIGSQLVRLRNPDYSPYRQSKGSEKKLGNFAFCRVCLAWDRIAQSNRSNALAQSAPASALRQQSYRRSRASDRR